MSSDSSSSASSVDHQRLREDWYIPNSLSASNTLNPIRNIVDKLQVPQNASKSLIPLSIGDPTVFGNLHPPTSVAADLNNLLLSGKHNGYAPSTGTLPARTAIIQKYGKNQRFPITPNDVIIASGASGAIQIALEALCSEGDNILVPRPGFSLYQTLAGNLGVEVRYYDLDSTRNFEVDLNSVEKLVDKRTRTIIINNPSNPCGSNFSKDHLMQILHLCEKMKLPILADEIYADMVFGDNKFYALGDLSEEVPIIAIGGIAKQYVVPGWRVGWIIIHDRQGRLKKVHDGMIALSQQILGCNTLIQGLLPSLLLQTPQSYYETLNKTLEDQAMFLYNSINEIQGLRAILPQGAMYLMVEILIKDFPAFTDDRDFAKQLLTEELVFVLPGQCFQASNFVRLVVCAPKHILEQAVARMKAFCERYYKQNKTISS